MKQHRACVSPATLCLYVVITFRILVNQAWLEILYVVN